MNKNYISLDTSVLYRSNQKYFDEILAPYNIGYAHLIFLIEIYEHDGISMNELAVNGSFDKGTVTKSIQKLVELGYVSIKISESDRRLRLLYTTLKTRDIIHELYKIRQERWQYLSQDLNDEEKDKYQDITSILVARAREYEKNISDKLDIAIYDIKKLSLTDFKGQICSTLYTGGCNFCCPHCDQKELVFLKENRAAYHMNKLLDYLESRKGIVDGVCIDGGEPLLSKGLYDFIKIVKEMGFKVKIITNGFYFQRLKELIDNNLLDFVTMDIKNSPRKYLTTVGLDEINFQLIKDSIELLISSDIDYEFRTTVIEEMHDESDIEEISKLLKGAKNYTIINYQGNSQNTFHPVSNEKLLKFKDIASRYIEGVVIK